MCEAGQGWEVRGRVLLRRPLLPPLLWFFFEAQRSCYRQARLGPAQITLLRGQRLHFKLQRGNQQGWAGLPDSSMWVRPWPDTPGTHQEALRPKERPAVHARRPTALAHHLSSVPAAVKRKVQEL